MKGGFKMFFGKKRRQQPIAERGKVMGANLFFRDREMVEDVSELCSNCRKEKANGRDGLGSVCRDISVRQANKPPVFYDAVIANGKAVPGK